MRGEIRDQVAYDQGKRLATKAWQEEHPPLPRMITPSDIDLVFDNNSCILMCELSRSAQWTDLDRGQRILYMNLIMNTHHCAVLCKHSVPAEQQICTRNDIESFQVLACGDDGEIYATPVREGNDRWQAFVRAWFDDSDKTRQRVLTLAKQDEPPAAPLKPPHPDYDLQPCFVCGAPDAPYSYDNGWTWYCREHDIERDKNLARLAAYNSNTPHEQFDG